MSIQYYVGAAVLAFGLATIAVADEPRKPGATGIFVPGSGRDLSIACLTNDRLQDDLKITAEQRKKLAPLAETFGKAHEEWRDNRRTDKVAASAAYKTAQADAKKGVDALLTIEQAARLTQIERQVAGNGALLDEENAKALELTAGQRDKLRTIHFDRLREMANARVGIRYGGIDAKVQKQIDETAEKAIDATLTNEQKKAWKDLLGTPFDTRGFQFQPTFRPAR